VDSKSQNCRIFLDIYSMLLDRTRDVVQIDRQILGEKKMLNIRIAVEIIFFATLIIMLG
jgi:hypothetical protein